MDQLMQANLQIIELLGAVFEEVERHDARASGFHADLSEMPARLRTWVGQPRAADRGKTTSQMNAMN